MKNVLLSLLCTLSLSTLGLAADKGLFTYDASRALNVDERVTETSASFKVRDISFSGVNDEKLRAYLVAPQGEGPYAAILYVHWLGPVNSDRTEFFTEAKNLAGHGVISLLIDMPWATPNWFKNRKLSDDYEFSIRQVKNLRRALDVLLSEKNVDKDRVAFVGHDFGAMYGSVLAGVDPRVHYAVFMAATPVFSDWFLLGTKIQGQELKAYKASMAPLDPTNYAAQENSLPVLFQFSKHDRFVPEERAQLFFQSASTPKQVLWYEAGHELDDQAAADRVKWLKDKLKLTNHAAGK